LKFRKILNIIQKQESNISEILGEKDEKKDSAFETSESETETRDRKFNEIVTVTELTLEKPRYKDQNQILLNYSQKDKHVTKRDSGTISPTLSEKIVQSKSAKYETEKKPTGKINEKLKSTLEEMFDNEGIGDINLALYFFPFF